MPQRSQSWFWRMILRVFLCLNMTLPAQPQIMNVQRPDPFFDSLNRQANAKDDTGIAALFRDIHARTITGPLPQSVLARLVRAQKAFLEGKAPVTEAAVADGVNAMGRELNSTI